MKEIIILVFCLFSFQLSFSQEQVIPSPYHHSVGWGKSLTVGDFNGDEQIDLVILAIKFQDSTKALLGSFSVYYAKNGEINTSPDVIFSPKLPGHLSGISKSASGDFNNDGFDDLVVSNQFYGEPQLDRGFMELYWGSATGLNTQDTLLKIGKTAYGSFGSNLICTDFNGDGIDDLIVESRFAELLEGRIYIYLGGKSFSLKNPDFELAKENSQALYVVFTSDFNNDGIDDIFCRSNTNWNANLTQVSIFYGGKSVNTSVDQNFEIENFSPLMYVPNNKWMLGVINDANRIRYTGFIEINAGGFKKLDFKVEGKPIENLPGKWIFYSSKNSSQLSEYKLDENGFTKKGDWEILPENSKMYLPFFFQQSKTQKKYLIIPYENSGKENILLKSFE